MGIFQPAMLVYQRVHATKNRTEHVLLLQAMAWPSSCQSHGLRQGICKCEVCWRMREFIWGLFLSWARICWHIFFCEIRIFFIFFSPKLAGFLSLINFTSKDYFYSICWVPSQDSTYRKDDIPFLGSGNPYTHSFVTVTGQGDNPKYMIIRYTQNIVCTRMKSLSSQHDFTPWLVSAVWTSPFHIGLYRSGQMSRNTRSNITTRILIILIMMLILMLMIYWNYLGIQFALELVGSCRMDAGEIMRN